MVKESGSEGVLNRRRSEEFGNTGKGKDKLNGVGLKEIRREEVKY